MQTPSSLLLATRLSFPTCCSGTFEPHVLICKMEILKAAASQVLGGLRDIQRY